MLDDDDAISLTSSDPATGALLGYAQEEQEMSEGEEVETEPSQSYCPAYDKLLEVMERATARLDLPWKRAKMAVLRRKKKKKKKKKGLFSSRIHRFQHTSHADIKGMRENGYEGMPPVKDARETSSLKAPSLPSKPLQKNICSSRSGCRFVAHDGSASGIPG